MDEDGNVQTYLTKHKISSLFEDLMSKVVKELPPDPIDFLIKKLQILQRHRKKDPLSSSLIKGSHGVPSSSIPMKGSHGVVPSISPAKVSRGRIQVTGTSVASKTPTKSPISDRLSKSTSGLRPVKAKLGLSSPSAPALSKTTPTNATPTRPSTATRPIAASGSKSTSKIPAVSGIRSKPSSRPSSGTNKQTGSTIPVGSKVAPTLQSPGKAFPKPGKASSLKTPTGKIPTATPGAKVSPCSKPPSLKSSSKQEPKVSSNPPTGVPAQAVPKEEVIDEFFGQARKSSQKQFYPDSEDEMSDLGVQSDDGSEDSEEGVASHVTHSEGRIDLQHIMEKRRCKHAKKSHRPSQDLLAIVAGSSSAPLCLDYDDGSGSGESSDTGVEMWEDADVLRDEGVEVAGQCRTIRKSSAAEEVIICARCAQALGKGNQLVLTALEFESASQVGSHSSYPQWGSEELAAEQQSSYGASERDPETCSDITLQSHDTWGGLAPPAPLEPQISDEESVIQLPPPPPLQGHDWLPQTESQGNAHGWGQQT